MVAQAAVKRGGKLFLRNCNELHEGRTPFAPVNVAALAIQLLIESKDHDIRYLIHGKGIGSRQSPFVLDHWIVHVRRGNALSREFEVTDVWSACLERVARFRPNVSVLQKVRSLYR